MKIYATTAYILAFLMTVLNYAPSFSQLADTMHEYLLYGFLGSVVMAFMKRNELFDEATAFMFIMVGVFSVNSTSSTIEILHLIFTGLAIITAYISLIVNQTDKIMKISSYASFGVGALLFSFGYFFNWYSVAVSELLVSTTLLIPFYRR